MVRTLRDYQLTGAHWLAERRTALLADEMGIGKTAELIEGVRLTGLSRIAVVCPLILCEHWIDELHRWQPDWTTVRLQGRKSSTYHVQQARFWDSVEVLVLNYDILNAHADMIKHWAHLVIFDESHYLMNATSQRSRAALDIARHPKMTVWLATGTPMPSKPKQLIHQLDILGWLDRLGGFNYFIKRYCNAKLVWVPTGKGRGKKVWDYDGSSNLPELSSKLVDRGVMLRRLRRDVMPEISVMPPAVVPVPLASEKMSEYEAARKNIADYMSQRAYELARSTGGMEPTEAAMEAARRALAAKHLVELGQLRRLLGEAKVPSVCAWVKEWMEGSEDAKLIVFAHHRSVIDSLSATLGGAKLYGGMDENDRSANLARFRSDRGCRLLLASTPAVGIGIDLTVSSDVVFVEYEWTISAHRQAQDRVARHGQRNVVAVSYLVGTDTVDRRMATHIAEQVGSTNAFDAVDDIAPIFLEGIL